MREKGIITQAEYESALAEIGASVGHEAEEAPSLVIGKWSATLYGFAELDTILDSTQSFTDAAGNGLVQRQNGQVSPPPAPQSTYAGDHGRLQFSVRNSRLGLRVRAPETAHVRASGTLEMDFLGYDPSPNYADSSEASYFNNPAIRIRLAYFNVETPVVDVLVGQSWHLFGWQPVFHPNTVEIQGVVGELYQRTAQVRLSHRFVLGPTSLEIAAAASRPPQRDSMIPEATAGLRFSIDKWTGLGTRAATAKELMPASIAVTGTMRNFVVPKFVQPDPTVQTSSVSLTTAAVAVAAFLPLIPAKKGHEGNSLSLTGQFVMGAGIADLFTGLTGGMAMPTIPNTSGQQVAGQVYPQNVDNGLVVFDTCGNNDPAVRKDLGSSCFDLHPVYVNAYMGGLQYYLPGLKGRVWISGNYAHVDLPDIGNYTRQDLNATNPNDYNYVNYTQVRKSEDWFDANLFLDPVDGVRIGLEYAHFEDRYVDGIHAVHHRGQISGFFIF